MQSSTPRRISAFVSRKIGLPNYSSIESSIGVEADLGEGENAENALLVLHEDLSRLLDSLLGLRLSALKTEEADP